MSVRIDRIKFIAEMAKQEIGVVELAEKADVSRSTITSIRSGKSCKNDIAIRISTALGVPVEALLPDA